MVLFSSGGGSGLIPRPQSSHFDIIATSSPRADIVISFASGPASAHTINESTALHASTTWNSSLQVLDLTIDNSAASRFAEVRSSMAIIYNHFDTDGSIGQFRLPAMEPGMLFEHGVITDDDLEGNGFYVTNSEVGVFDYHPSIPGGRSYTPFEPIVQDIDFTSGMHHFRVQASGDGPIGSMYSIDGRYVAMYSSPVPIWWLGRLHQCRSFARLSATSATTGTKTVNVRSIGFHSDTPIPLRSVAVSRAATVNVGTSADVPILGIRVPATVNGVSNICPVFPRLMVGHVDGSGMMFTCATFPATATPLNGTWATESGSTVESNVTATTINLTGASTRMVTNDHEPADLGVIFAPAQGSAVKYIKGVGSETFVVYARKISGNAVATNAVCVVQYQFPG